MKNTILLFAILFFMVTQLLAQNNAPEVTNVTFSQRTDGSFMVDVYYNLNDADGNPMTVSMEVSDDNGTTWDFTCNNIIGDIGNGISSGANKHIIWDFGVEHPQTFGDQFRVKVLADDGVSLFGWVTIPAGNYTYGPGDTIKTIAYDYQIMKYVVTNQQYVDYLEEALAAGSITVNSSVVQGYYSGDPYWSAGIYEFYDLDFAIGSYNIGQISWNGTNFVVPAGYENHPVVLVTWFGANAFAEHYGYKLPTEFEWEKTARGSTGWDYPWGNSIDGSRANYFNSGDPFDQGTTPVGYYDGSNHSGFQTTNSPSPYGAYDMAGNVWQWGGPSPSYKVMRGGGWASMYTDYLRSWNRLNWNDPIQGNPNIGFRISRNL